MSRSRRKTLKAGHPSRQSEKWDKGKYNRRFRRACNQLLQINPFCQILPHLLEKSNVWSMSKEGKHWFDGKKDKKRMRK
ncbi:MAG: hypothetical protein M3Q99_04720 [Acidobacteriota bacterium]|nr:hypothetical protein [Acidobacteriota bacterium]